MRSETPHAKFFNDADKRLANFVNRPNYGDVSGLGNVCFTNTKYTYAICDGVKAGDVELTDDNTALLQMYARGRVFTVPKEDFVIQNGDCYSCVFESSDADGEPAVTAKIYFTAATASAPNGDVSLHFWYPARNEFMRAHYSDFKRHLSKATNFYVETDEAKVSTPHSNYQSYFAQPYQNFNTQSDFFSAATQRIRKSVNVLNISPPRPRMNAAGRRKSKAVNNKKRKIKDVEVLELDNMDGNMDDDFSIFDLDDDEEVLRNRAKLEFNNQAAALLQSQLNAKAEVKNTETNSLEAMQAQHAKDMELLKQQLQLQLQREQEQQKQQLELRMQLQLEQEQLKIHQQFAAHNANGMTVQQQPLPDGMTPAQSGGMIKEEQLPPLPGGMMQKQPLPGGMMQQQSPLPGYMMLQQSPLPGYMMQQQSRLPGGMMQQQASLPYGMMVQQPLPVSSSLSSVQVNNVQQGIVSYFQGREKDDEIYALRKQNKDLELQRLLDRQQQFF